MTDCSIPELLRAVSSAHPDRVAYRSKRGGRWTDITWAENTATCRQISKALIALGVKKGDRVAILSQTRLEWVQCDLGIVGCCGVTVGIYPSSTAADCRSSLETIPVAIDRPNRSPASCWTWRLLRR